MSGDVEAVPNHLIAVAILFWLEHGNGSIDVSQDELFGLEMKISKARKKRAVHIILAATSNHQRNISTITELNKRALCGLWTKEQDGDENQLRLPIVWIIAKTLDTIFTCRIEKKACTLFNSRAQLEASVMLLRKTRHGSAAEKLQTLVSQV